MEKKKKLNKGLKMDRNSYNSTMMLEKIRSLTQSCIQELFKTLSNISITCKQISSVNEIRLYDSLVRLLIRLSKVFPPKRKLQFCSFF